MIMIPSSLVKFNYLFILPKSVCFLRSCFRCSGWYRYSCYVFSCIFFPRRFEELVECGVLMSRVVRRIKLPNPINEPQPEATCRKIGLRTAEIGRCMLSRHRNIPLIWHSIPRRLFISKAGGHLRSKESSSLDGVRRQIEASLKSSTNTICPVPHAQFARTCGYFFR